MAGKGSTLSPARIFATGTETKSTNHDKCKGKLNENQRKSTQYTEIVPKHVGRLTEFVLQYFDKCR